MSGASSLPRRGENTQSSQRPKCKATATDGAREVKTSQKGLLLLSGHELDVFFSLWALVI